MTAPSDIDDYINSFPLEAQNVLQKIRQTILAAAPDAKEKISYGIPTFTLSGNLIHFAAYDNHFAIYPGAAPVEQFKEQLKGYTTFKGTIQFPTDKPVPYNLIREITKSCVARNLGKGK
jgi:uncharacterized protein YdhG (YjbR/CyaY superfamily)